MRTFIRTLLVFCLLVGHAAAADIIQGRCISMDRKMNVMSVEIYDTRFTRQHPYGVPTGRVLKLFMKGARMDTSVRGGSFVRVAYNIEGTRVFALRIMRLPDLTEEKDDK